MCLPHPPRQPYKQACSRRTKSEVVALCLLTFHDSLAVHYEVIHLSGNVNVLLVLLGIELLPDLKQVPDVLWEEGRLESVNDLFASVNIARPYPRAFPAHSI